MKIIIPVFLFSSLFLLSSSPTFAADKDKSMLDVLSEEAKETSMEEGSAPEETTPEPSIVPKVSTDFSDLEGKISTQLKSLLTDKSNNLEEKSEKGSDFQNKLESIVSSALLKGNKLDDIRNAVSAAMVDIKSEDVADISETTIESATKALKGIVGESKEALSGDKPDAYTQSLHTKLPDDSSSESESKDTESTLKEVAKATAATKNTEASVPATQAIAFEAPKSEQKTAILADTIRVLEGETLFKIAQRVYGSGANYLALYEANKDTIKDPNLIRIGQILKIPR